MSAESFEVLGVPPEEDIVFKAEDGEPPLPSPKSVATTVNLKKGGDHYVIQRGLHIPVQRPDLSPKRQPKERYDSYVDRNLRHYWKRQEEVRIKLREERDMKMGRVQVGVARSPHSKTTRGSVADSLASTGMKRYAPQQPLHDAEAASLRCFAPPGTVGRIAHTVKFDSVEGVDLSWLARRGDYLDGAFGIRTNNLPALCGGQCKHLDSPRSIIILFRNGLEVHELLPRDLMSFRLMEDGASYESEELWRKRKETYDAKRSETTQAVLMQYKQLTEEVDQSHTLDIVFDAANTTQDSTEEVFQKRVERDKSLEGRRQNRLQKNQERDIERQEKDQKRRIQLELHLARRKEQLQKDGQEKAEAKQAQMDRKRAHRISQQAKLEEARNVAREALETRLSLRHEKIQEMKNRVHQQYKDRGLQLRQKSEAARKYIYDTDEARYASWEKKLEEIAEHEQRLQEREEEAQAIRQESRARFRQHQWVTTKRAEYIRDAQLHAILDVQKSVADRKSEIAAEKEVHRLTRQENWNTAQAKRDLMKEQAAELVERNRSKLVARHEQIRQHEAQMKVDRDREMAQRVEASMQESSSKELARQRRLKQFQYEAMVTLTSMHLKAAKTEANAQSRRSLVCKTKSHREVMRLNEEEFQNKFAKDTQEKRKRMFTSYYDVVNPRQIFPDIDGHRQKSRSRVMDLSSARKEATGDATARQEEEVANV